MNSVANRSLAVAQRSVVDDTLRFPLFPPILDGVRSPHDPDLPQPLELDFDYARVDASLFEPCRAAGGLGRWAPLMAPLVDATDLGEGATPLVPAPRLAAWAGLEAPLYIKDESRNPTWSHKDRLNRCTVSAACLVDAPGIVVASSGNHGASAAAYAARAGLPCIVLASASAPLAMRSFVQAYGAAALAVAPERRWGLLASIVEATGYHPVSNLSPQAHTGHPFGTEGYKSIAYEIVHDLGGTVPACVFVPTGYAELLYGVWKGFRELRDLGVTRELPAMMSCEPAALAPHHRAQAQGTPVVAVKQPDGETRALSIASPVGGLRGRTAVLDSGGTALAVSDAEIAEASAALARDGFWVEFSSAASLAGLRRHLRGSAQPERPVVCISTSAGLKDVTADATDLPAADSVAEVQTVLRSRYGIVA